MRRRAPSALSAVYWIEAKRRKGDFPAPTARAGEWQIRLSVENVDGIWERVKALTVAGKLGLQVQGINRARNWTGGSGRAAALRGAHTTPAILAMSSE